jgi:hypothetical protein
MCDWYTNQSRTIDCMQRCWANDVWYDWCSRMDLIQCVLVRGLARREELEYHIRHDCIE